MAVFGSSRNCGDETILPRALQQSKGSSDGRLQLIRIQSPGEELDHAALFPFSKSSNPYAHCAKSKDLAVVQRAWTVAVLRCNPFSIQDPGFRFRGRCILKYVQLANGRNCPPQSCHPASLPISISFSFAAFFSPHPTPDGGGLF